MSSIIRATTTSGLQIAPDNSGSLQLQTNGSTTALTIDTSQNVGIGTTSPAYKLDIVSNVNAIVAQRIYNSNSGSGAYSFLWFGNDISSQQAAIFVNSSATTTYGGAGSLNIYQGAAYPIAFMTNNVERMRIDSSGGLILAGSTAQKATGTTWSNPSDQRLKDNIRDYTKGTTELMQVRVREWEYNGKGGTTEGMKGLGVIADEVMTVLPNTVETYDAKLNTNDENNTAIKKFDATEITWLLVKTVQEQQTIINDLKARIETLEAK